MESVATGLSGARVAGFRRGYPPLAKVRAELTYVRIMGFESLRLQLLHF